MSSNSEDILVIENLKKYFNDVKAVDGISFHIKKGEIYGLLGPNGAGKTTTLKCILGLLFPNEGNINVLGHDPFKDDYWVKAHIGYVAEESLIYKALTPRELFDFIASARKLKAEKITPIIKDLLKSLEAEDYYDKPIVTLSKGNMQKIQIIAALMHEPPLLILDEPLSGLDARSNKVIKQILEIHKEKGGAVLFSTHILEVAENLCDRIGILNKGKLIAEGTLEELGKITQEVGASLEDIFLKLTEQDDSIKSIIDKLKLTLK
ncbi:MAG: ABC transporter ATP-binding protein [Promethearchaeota archaeon]